MCAYIFFFSQRETDVARFRWIRKELEKLPEEVETVLLQTLADMGCKTFIWIGLVLNLHSKAN